MQPSEALTTSAQLAVALAGFAGVVVAFRSGSVHQWSKIDKFRLRILLTNSATPFALSIAAMLLSSTSLDPERLWQMCSIVAFVVVIMVGQPITSGMRTLSREDFQRGGVRRSVLVCGGVAITAVIFLQLYNAISLKTFWPFFAIIATQLALGMLQFVLLVVADHDQNGGN
jgi:hypothetical protein